jgi:hypothetical protein
MPKHNNITLAKYLKNYLLILLGMQMLIFILPRYVPLLDRFGNGTLKKEYGYIVSQTNTFDYATLALQVLLILIVLFAYKNNKNVAIKNTMIRKKNVHPFVAALFVLFASMPFFIFGEGDGFFWTVGLLYSIYLIPFFVKERWQMFIFIMMVPIGLFRGSKADIIYIVLTLFLLKLNKINYKYVVFAIIFIPIGMYISLIIRNETELFVMLPQLVVFREYAMEVTAISLHYLNSGIIWPEYALLTELYALVPHFIVGEKLQPGHYFVAELMPLDYELLPDAGFYRSLYFAYIMDFGYFGIVIAAWFFYTLVSFSFKSVMKKGVGTIGFLLLYYIHFIINGEIPFYLSHVLLPVFLLTLMFLFNAILNNRAKLIRFF